MGRLLPAALAVGLVLLAGCSGDDDPEPKISPTDSSSVASTPTPSPTPSGPVEPTMPAEAEGEDAAAAEAFVRHFWAMVNYAQTTGDVQALEGLALGSCQTCASGAKWIADVYQRGGLIEGGKYDVGPVRVTPLGAGGQRLFEVVADVTTTPQRVSGADELNGSFPAGNSRVRLVLLNADGGLKVSRWDVDQ
ncbi:DUF6318 family protein [Nocardioides lianchengensis]|uniref:DUF6318 family protein n=1 Tax=Nocardioides lianchengensis TaxID=1045774 RepID=UPI000A48C03D|nr:DUF6318 family protein [Nocardioides lianchengensis]NYG11381.1 hypothetical protein [Nocardioides lianchengensis]